LKLLLTGATGFLGSQLLNELVNNNHEIVILKRSFSNTTRISSIIDKVISYDIDKINLKDIFKCHQIECVVHLATTYGRNGEVISDIVKNNLLFSIELLELSIKNHVSTFINADTLQNKNVSNYTLSKKQFVEWGFMSSRLNEIEFINLRIEHLFGPGDDDNKFVYWIINQLLANTKEINLTNGHQKRDFIYIEDAVTAILSIISSPFKSGFSEFDIGTGYGTTVKEFVLQLKKEIEKKIKVDTKLNFGAIQMRENEPIEIIANNLKLKSLGWEPNFDVKEGVEKMINQIFITK
jgi:nucleoside-diphosphate-sugar epimerase